MNPFFRRLALARSFGWRILSAPYGSRHLWRQSQWLHLNWISALRTTAVLLGDFPLSRVLLMNDSRYPWVILVPKVAGIEEVYQRGEADQAQLVKECSFVASQSHSCSRPIK